VIAKGGKERKKGKNKSYVRNKSFIHSLGARCGCGCGCCCRIRCCACRLHDRVLKVRHDARLRRGALLLLLLLLLVLSLHAPLLRAVGTGQRVGGGAATALRHAHSMTRPARNVVDVAARE
jgi:hypothetical protein